jgi:hypothetical protein
MVCGRMFKTVTSKETSQTVMVTGSDLSKINGDRIRIRILFILKIK